MTKIINKSVIMLYDITLLMFIGIIRNIFVLYCITTLLRLKIVIKRLLKCDYIVYITSSK